MAIAQELTETPDWTIDEEVLCAKIMSEVERGQVKIYRLR